MLALVLGELVGCVAARAFLPSGRSRVRQARSDAMTVRSAAEMFLAEDPSADCPTMKDLVSAHIINSATSTTDPWGNPFDIRCDGTAITVSSAGMRERADDE
jgi:hypothetical protein